MKRGQTISWLLAGCAGLVAANVAQADVVSTFDTGVEGWTLANGGFFPLAWSATLGNPGGCLQGREGSGGRLWYYAAPAAFYGDQSSMIGGSLSWDIRNIITGSLAGAAADVILHGAGIRIGYAIPGNADLPEWQTFSVPLSASGWFVMPGGFPDTPFTGTPVTESQFADVLADVTALYIQGEYRNGGDSSALDNVIMAPAICPACAADYDGNGGVDGGDLAAFFTDFEAGEGCADVDGNGGVDGGDLAEFFLVFEAGGC